MARNEEKQLARLNRLHLQKQREEELKKRPPRPKLETLTTAEEVTKWLPSITRDIEFYVKQMEVPCYQDQQIEEFSKRIGHLKGEYKAFVRKLRQLNPENKVTPWTDRPYEVKRQKFSQDIGEFQDGNGNCDSEKPSTVDEAPKFNRIHTPVLDKDEAYKHNFGYEKPQRAMCPDLSEDSMNQPLFSSSAQHSDVTTKDKCATNFEGGNSPLSCNESSISNGGLNLPYSDSSSSGDDT